MSGDGIKLCWDILGELNDKKDRNRYKKRRYSLIRSTAAFDTKANMYLIKNLWAVLTLLKFYSAIKSSAEGIPPWISHRTVLIWWIPAWSGWRLVQKRVPVRSSSDRGQAPWGGGAPIYCPNPCIWENRTGCVPKLPWFASLPGLFLPLPAWFHRPYSNIGKWWWASA